MRTTLKPGMNTPRLSVNRRSFKQHGQLSGFLPFFLNLKTNGWSNTDLLLLVNVGYDILHINTY